MDVTSLGTDDLALTGVTVDRAQLLGGGLVRYWYNDDGQQLPTGLITGTMPAGRVRDVAGNGDDAASATFAVANAASISGCVYADVNNNGRRDPSELGLPNVPVALQNASTGQLLRDGIVTLPFADANHDGYLSPLGVLAVINQLNNRPVATGEGESGPTSSQAPARSTALVVPQAVSPAVTAAHDACFQQLGQGPIADVAFAPTEGLDHDDPLDRALLDSLAGSQGQDSDLFGS